jgi:hypothetical protein
MVRLDFQKLTDLLWKQAARHRWESVSTVSSRGNNRAAAGAA